MKIAMIELGVTNADSIPDVTFSWHNHGIAMLVTIARQKGYDVDFFNLKEFSSFHDFLAKPWKDYDMAAISAMSSDLPQLDVVTRAIKLTNPGCFIIVGGIAATATEWSLLENYFIDLIIKGDGEIQLFEQFERFGELGAYRSRNLIKPVADLDSLPFIDRDIYKNPLERNVDGWGDSPMATIITARGCPFNCKFCQPAERNHFGAKVRRRSPQNVIAEIVQLTQNYDPQFLVFYDDSFAYDKKWLKEFIGYYTNIGLPFLASARADFICKNPKIIESLAEVGMTVCSVGFESGSDRILKMIDKGTTVKQNYEAADILDSLGVKIFANIMYGFPTETKDEQLETLKLCEYIKKYPSMISPAYFTPFPGSYLGEECINKGISLIGNNNYVRYGRDKIAGIDYNFLDSFVWR